MTDERKVDWETEYASRVTFIHDLSIVLRTFGYLLRRPPVY
jgi:O-antigen biosynthesis protein WbqP